MSKFLVFFICIIAACLLGSAAYLGFYGKLPNGIQFNPNVLSPLIAHLALSGCALALSGRALHRMQKAGEGSAVTGSEFISLWPTLLLGAISLALAVQAIWAWNNNHLWVTTLIIPGLVGFAASAVLYEYIASREEDQSLGTMWRDIVRWTGRLLILGIGLLYWRLLSSILLAGQHLTLSNTLQELKTIYQQIGPQIFAFVVVSLLLFALTAAVTLFYRFVKSNQPSARSRTLTSYEHQYVEKCHSELISYVSRHPYQSGFRTLHRGFYIAFLPLMLLVAVPLMTFEELILPLISSYQTSGLNWSLYIDRIGVSGVLVVFATILVYWALYLIVCRLWPSFFEWVVAHTSFPWSGDGGDQGLKLIISLEDAVQNRALLPGRPFSPEVFLRSVYKSIARPMYLATAASVLAALFFLYRDHADYDLFTDDHIETVDYWSSAKKRMSYADVKIIKITCSTHKRVSFNYNVVLNEANTVRLLSSNKRVFSARLSDYERVDQRLVAANVPVAYTQIPALFGFRSPTSKAACRDAIRTRYDTEMSARLIKLLHLNASAPEPNESAPQPSP